MVNLQVLFGFGVNAAHAAALVRLGEVQLVEGSAALTLVTLTRIRVLQNLPKLVLAVLLDKTFLRFPKPVVSFTPISELFNERPSVGKR